MCDSVARMRFHFEIKNYLQKDASCIPAINWEMIEKEKNIIFPDDYKWFLEYYGGGSINDFLWIFSPVCSNPNLNSLDQFTNMKKSYDYMINGKFIDYEYVFYDNCIGLFPWGITDNGDELYWNFLNDRIEIVIIGSGYADVLSYQMNMTDFLSGLLTRKIECNLFPDDFVLEKNYYTAVE